jgi:shikimate kinase
MKNERLKNERLLILIVRAKDDSEHTELTRYKAYRKFKKEIGANAMSGAWLDHKPDINEVYAIIEDHLEDAFSESTFS